MTEALEIAQIQQEMQKETASISMLNNFTENHHKCLQFMFNAEYQLILQSFQFKHAAYLQKKIADNSKSQQAQQIIHKYETLSQKNHKKLSKHNNHIDRLLNRLQFQWAQKRTHYFHRYYFEKYIDNDMSHYGESLEKILLNEEKLIKSQLHVIYAIDRAIKAREGCLNEIGRVLGTLSGADIEDYLSVCEQRVYYYRSRKEKLQYKIYGYKINKVLDKKVTRKVFHATKFQHFGQLINHYRKLTVHVVELICKWKQYIYSLTFDHQKHRQPIDYYFDNLNYLLKIINDNTFVSHSFLNDYFRFSPKNDPFLLMPLIKLENDELTQTKSIANSNHKWPNPQNLIKLKCLKRVLAPESESELIQILQKIIILTTEYQTNIKKRKTFDLRTIHKINNLDYHKSFNNLSKSQVKLKSKQTAPNDLTKSTVTSLRSNSLQLSKLSMVKPLKTVQSGQILPLKRQNTSSFRKKTLIKLSDPGSKKNTIFQKQHSATSPNPQTTDNLLKTKEKLIQNKIVNPRQLQSIKQQIKLKIKSQLKLTHEISHHGIFKKPQLASYIDDQVRKLISQSQNVYNMNNMMTQLSKDFSLTNINHQNPIFVDTYSIEESQLPSHLKSIFQHQSLLKYQFMQYSMEQLINGKQQHSDKRDFLQNLPCIYFLKVKEKTLDSLSIQEKIISNIIFTIKYMQKPSDLPHQKNFLIQRTAQVLYMTIKSHNFDYISKAITKTVEFLFKYETAKTIIFTFLYNEDIEFQRQKITELKFKVQKSNCSIFERVLERRSKKGIGYSLKQEENEQKGKMTQVKFCFSRKQQKKNLFVENNQNLRRLKSDPLSLSIKMNGMLSEQKINLTTSLTQSQQKQILSRVNYDYLLTQILKNHVDSDTFRTISQNELWQHRLRALIENILIIKQKQKHQETLPFLQLQTFASISDLNEARNLLQKPSWINVSDFDQSGKKFTNKIRLMSLELKLSLPYLGRAFINSKGRPYFRFQIKEKIEVLKMQYRTIFKQKHQLQEVHKQKIYLFQCLEKKNIKIGLFDATKLSQFIDNENAKITQSGKKQAILTLSDLINSLSFINTQNHGRSMKLIDKQTIYVGNMYIPMIHSLVTQKPSQQYHSTHLTPIQVQDLKSISKNQSNQFIFSDNLLWQYDVCLENGIRYDSQKQRNALAFQSGNLQNQSLKREMGIIVFLIPEFIVIYSKII